MRRALVICALVLGCSGTRVPQRPTPVADALFATAHAWSDDTIDDAWATVELDRIADDVSSLIRAQPKLLPSGALEQAVFRRAGFVREVDDASLRFALLPSVLRDRRGSCVGLGSLYLALGERLGWKVAGVMVPGHFYVRIEEAGTHHNIELLHAGELMPDAWYPARFPIPGGAAPEYARALTTTEVLGVIEYNAGNQLRQKRRLRDAQHAYSLAAKHFPDFAEAHASLGATDQLLGLHAQARAAYAAALRANPNLPGVDKNLALLEAELPR